MKCPVSPKQGVNNCEYFSTIELMFECAYSKVKLFNNSYKHDEVSSRGGFLSIVNFQIVSHTKVHYGWRMKSKRL